MNLPRVFSSYWQLFRLEHGIMYGTGVIVGIVVAGGSTFQNFLFGFLTALFLQASAFALNDYFDYEVDVANQRMDRPLVRGELTRKNALISAVLLLPVGLITSLFISIPAFILASAISALGFFYDMKLKELGFAGNVYIAFTMSAPFIFGSFVARNSLTFDVGILSALAFFSGLGREIMKGIEDVRGDALRNVKSLARVFGIRSAGIIASMLLLLSVLISPLPALYRGSLYYHSRFYTGLVLVTDLILIHVSLNLLKGKMDIGKMRKETLLGMLAGLFAFLFGAMEVMV